MNAHTKRIAVIATGALLFSIIFWNEKMALNAVLYDLFLLPALFYFFPGSLKNKTVLWLLAGHLTCTAMVVLHNTLLSKIGCGFTLFVTTAFIQYQHRSPWYAGATVLTNSLFSISEAVKDIVLALSSKDKKRSVQWGKIIRFSVFPLLLLILFFVIYSFANSAFAELQQKIMQHLQNLLDHLLELISVDRILFFFLGFYITGVLLEKTGRDHFSKKDLAHEDALTRKKYTLKKGFFYQVVSGIVGKSATGNLALKTQNTIGIMSLLLLNILLLIVNCIDIDTIWFHFEFSPGKPIYQLVHEGTGLLILSIITAMAILLFFFKGNLNFYTRNKWLKYGAFAWIIQNTILVISVLLRDYYYIQYYGLAYKRIGVLFYLLMVIAGLVTMCIKIYSRKTTYHLMKVNAWAAIVLLVAACTIHWDKLIASYNITHSKEVSFDMSFLLSLSDAALPLLEENKTILEKEGHVYIDQTIHNRVAHFQEQQKNYSWLSWNYADAQVTTYFKNKPQVATR